MINIKNKKKVFLILLGLLLLSGWFYWFQIRPAMIRSYCAKQVYGFGNIGASIERKEFAYNQCLHARGLE